MSLLQIGNLVALVLTLVVNFLSQTAVELFGVMLFPNTVAELGESRAIFFLPAGYVFAIWGVIYLGMIAFIIYQSRPSVRGGEVVRAIGPWFILSSVGNIGWIFLFLNNQLALSTVAIVLLLVSLIMIYLRLGIGRRPVSNTVRWSVHIPFSIYLGWVSVATVANTSAWLYVENNVTSLLSISADIWAVVMMAIAAVLAVLMLATRRDVAYALVVVWALVGIYVRPFTTETFAPVANLNIDLVNTVALLIAIVIGVLALLRLGSNVMRASQTSARAAA